MVKSNKKIKESPYQQSIMIKCHECQKGYFGNKSCSAGQFVKSKISHLGCWQGEKIEIKRTGG